MSILFNIIYIVKYSNCKLSTFHSDGAENIHKSKRGKTVKQCIFILWTILINKSSYVKTNLFF